MHRALVLFALLTAPSMAVAKTKKPVVKDSVVVARIVDAGPIGSGKCSQRSYEIEIDKVESGPSPGAKLWVHFEHCAGAPAPADLAGTGMKTGTAYRLTLRPGASRNFGGDFMIVGARTP